MAMTYTKVGWQDGTILQPAKVTVAGAEYEVEPEVVSGTTPINSTNLGHMDDAIEEIVEELGQIEGGITELDSPVRIWNLSTGIYKIPKNCTIYYYGSSNTSTLLTVPSESVMVISEYSTTYKGFFIFGNSSSNRYIYNGYSTSSVGTVNNFDIGTSYFPNSSGTSLQSAIFGNGTTWSSSSTYSVDDIVTYNYKFYANLTGTNTSTNPASDATNWEEVSLF